MLIQHSYRGTAWLVCVRDGKRWRKVAAFAYQPGKILHGWRMLQNAKAWRYVRETAV